MLTKLKSLGAVGRQLLIWWSTPTDRDTQTGYFAERGLLDGVQLLIGLCTVLLGAVPLLAHFSPAGPAAPAGQAVSLGFAVSTVGWALMWWFGRWPSRGWSIAFIVYADVGIAVASLVDSNHLAGLFGVNALGLISLYSAFFEGPKTLTAHTAWMLVVAGAFGLLIGTGPHGDPYLAAAKVIAAMVALATTPVAIHFGIWVLRSDARQSVTDHLTGLLNRRGLNLRFGNLLRDGHHATATETIMVVMIDLDRFKEINDTHGHAVGDAVLVRSARRIQQTVSGTALVARVGGEEFIVADVVPAADIDVIANRIRVAIASPADPASVTASLGVTTVSLSADHLGSRNPVALLGLAIDHADQAMFRAKRKGGNVVSHCSPQTGTWTVLSKVTN